MPTGNNDDLFSGLVFDSNAENEETTSSSDNDLFSGLVFDSDTENTNEVKTSVEPVADVAPVEPLKTDDESVKKKEEEPSTSKYITPFSASTSILDFKPVSPIIKPDVSAGRKEWNLDSKDVQSDFTMSDMNIEEQKQQIDLGLQAKKEVDERSYSVAKEQIRRDLFNYNDSNAIQFALDTPIGSDKSDELLDKALELGVRRDELYSFLQEKSNEGVNQLGKDYFSSTKKKKTDELLSKGYSFDEAEDQAVTEINNNRNNLTFERMGLTDEEFSLIGEYTDLRLKPLKDRTPEEKVRLSLLENQVSKLREDSSQKLLDPFTGQISEDYSKKVEQNVSNIKSALESGKTDFEKLFEEYQQTYNSIQGLKQKASPLIAKWVNLAEGESLSDEAIDRVLSSNIEFEVPTAAKALSVVGVGEQAVSNQQDLANKLNNIKSLLRDEYSDFDALSRTVLLNEDPATISRGFEWLSDLTGGYVTGELLTSMGESLYEEVSGKEFASDRDVRQRYVQKAKEAGVSVTEAQVENAKATLSEQVGDAVGVSLPLMADIMINTVVLKNAASAAKLPARIKKLEMLTKSPRLGRFMTNFTDDMIQGLAFEFAGDDTDFMMGVGESRGARLAEKALDKVMGGKYGKFMTLLTRTMGGAAGSTFEEYAGDFVSEGMQLGFFSDEQLDSVFGRNFEEGRDKFIVTALMGLMFATPAEAGKLIAEGEAYYKKTNDTENLERIQELKTTLQNDVKATEAKNKAMSDLGFTKGQVLTPEQEQQVVSKIAENEKTKADQSAETTEPETEKQPAQPIVNISKDDSGDVEVTITGTFDGKQETDAFYSVKELSEKLDDPQFISSVNNGDVKINLKNAPAELEQKIKDKGLLPETFTTEQEVGLNEETVLQDNKTSIEQEELIGDKVDALVEQEQKSILDLNENTTSEEATSVFAKLDEMNPTGEITEEGETVVEAPFNAKDMPTDPLELAKVFFDNIDVEAQNSGKNKSNLLGSRFRVLKHVGKLSNLLPAIKRIQEGNIFKENGEMYENVKKTLEYFQEAIDNGAFEMIQGQGGITNVSTMPLSTPLKGVNYGEEQLNETEQNQVDNLSPGLKLSIEENGITADNLEDFINEMGYETEGGMLNERDVELLREYFKEDGEQQQTQNETELTTGVEESSVESTGEGQGVSEITEQTTAEPEQTAGEQVVEEETATEEAVQETEEVVEDNGDGGSEPPTPTVTSQKQQEANNVRRRNKAFLNRVLNDPNTDEATKDLLSNIDKKYTQETNEWQSDQADILIDTFDSDGRLMDLVREMLDPSMTDEDGGKISYGVRAMVLLKAKRLLEERKDNVGAAAISVMIDETARNFGKFNQALIDRGSPESILRAKENSWKKSKEDIKNQTGTNGKNRKENVDESHEDLSKEAENIANDIADNVNLEEAVKKAKEKAAKTKEKRAESKKKSEKAKSDIEKERNYRKERAKEFKKNHSKYFNSALGLTQDGLIFAADIASSYIRQGYTKAADLSRKLKEFFDKELDVKLTDDQINQILNHETNGSTILDMMFDAEKDKTSKKLAQRVAQTFSSKKNKATAELLQEILKELTSKAQEVLPKRAKNETNASYTERVLNALNNAELSSEIWDSAQNMVDKMISDMVEKGTIDSDQELLIREQLESYFGEFVGKPFSDAVLDKAISEQLKAFGSTAKDLVTDTASLNQFLNQVLNVFTNGVVDKKRAKQIQQAIRQNISNRVQAEVNKGVNKLAEHVINKVNDNPSNPKTKAVFDVLVDILRSKADDNLPKKKDSKVSEGKHLEKILTAIRNSGMAQTIWDDARVEVMDKLNRMEVNGEITSAEKSEILNDLQDYFGDFVGKPFSNSILNKAISEQMKSMDMQIRDIIKQHWTNQKEYGKTLAEKIVEGTGLTAQEALTLASQIEAEFEKKIKVAAEKALIKALGTSKLPINRIRKSTFEKIVEAYNLGALNSDLYTDLFAEHFGFYSPTVEDKAQIGKFIHNINLYPENSEARLRAIVEFNTYLDGLRDDSYGKKFVLELLTEIFYTNVLSGFSTVARGAKGIAMTAAAQIITLGAINPGTMFTTMEGVNAIWRGLKEGGPRFMSIMRDGFTPTSTKMDYKTGVLTDLVNTPFSELTPSSKLGKAFFYAPVKMVRALIAADALGHYAVREYASLVKAYNDVLLEGIKKNEADFWNKVHDKLKNNTADKQAALDQAKAEFQYIKDNGGSVKNFNIEKRAKEILFQKRGEANNAFAEDQADRARLGQDPLGILGFMYGVANNLSKNVTGVNRIIPFLKIPTNALDMWLDFSPWGIKRGFAGRSSILLAKQSAETKKRLKVGAAYMSKEDRIEHFTKAAIGTTVWISVLSAVIANQDEEDEDQWIQVSYKGYGKYSQNEGLRKNGLFKGDKPWKEMSWRVKNPITGEFSDWYSYIDSPLGMMMSTIGYASDKKKFSDEPISPEDNTVGTHVLAGVAHAGLFVTEQNYMKSFIDFANLFSRDSSTPVLNFLGNFTTSNLKATFHPSIYKQAYQAYNSFADKPKEVATRYSDDFSRAVFEKTLSDLPFITDALDQDKMFDQLGYPVTRDIRQIPLLPDLVIDGIATIMNTQNGTDGAPAWDVLNKHKIKVSWSTISDVDGQKLTPEEYSILSKEIATGLGKYIEYNYDDFMYNEDYKKDEISRLISDEKSYLADVAKEKIRELRGR